MKIFEKISEFLASENAIFGLIWTQFRSQHLAKMASWPNFKLFRPKLSPNWTKNGHFWSDLDSI